MINYKPKNGGVRRKDPQKALLIMTFLSSKNQREITRELSTVKHMYSGHVPLIEQIKATIIMGWLSQYLLHFVLIFVCFLSLGISIHNRMFKFLSNQDSQFLKSISSLPTQASLWEASYKQIIPGFKRSVHTCKIQVDSSGNCDDSCGQSCSTSWLNKFILTILKLLKIFWISLALSSNLLYWGMSPRNIKMHQREPSSKCFAS